jgi:prophage antirepressor-like protein
MKGKDRISRACSRRFGSLGILMIDGRPYLSVTGCSCALGHKDPHRAIRNHCKGVNESFSPTVKGTIRKAGHQPIQKGAAWSI